MKKIISITAVALFLHGCFDEYQPAAPIGERIIETKQMVSQKVRTKRIETLPTIDIGNTTLFYLSQGRDPFIATGVFSDLIKWGDYLEQQVIPKVRLPRDPTRPADYKPGPFEKYEIKSLTMIGIMSLANGETAALIDVGNDKIMMVRIGDYIGRDHGIVTEIEEKRVKVEEKYGSVQEGADAWILLPNEILLNIK